MDTSPTYPDPQPDDQQRPESVLEAPRPRRGRWRRLAAAGVAGGVLAASAAIPVTWHLAQRDSTAPTAGSTVTGSGSAGQAEPGTTDPGTTDPGDSSPYTAPFDRGSGTGDSGGRGRLGTSSAGGTQEDATTAESAGVVLVDTTLTNGRAAGSGMVLDPSGLVLTNYHVVEGSTEVSVTVASTGDTYRAEVIGSDEQADVALLQLEDASGLTTVALDDDGGAVVGDAITAVGNSAGQGYLSAAAGTVTALDQDITTSAADGSTDEDLTGLIEFDGYVVPGDSGGVVLDSEGEVVGITTAATSGGAAVGYAVPIDDALGVVDSIENGDEGDGVQIGPAAYLGISVDAEAGNVSIQEVEQDGAAAAAGLVAGDVLTTVDGSDVATFDDLRTALGAHEPGDAVTLGWRDAAGTSHTGTAVLGSSPIN